MKILLGFRKLKIKKKKSLSGLLGEEGLAIIRSMANVCCETNREQVKMVLWGVIEGVQAETSGINLCSVAHLLNVEAIFEKL